MLANRVDGQVHRQDSASPLSQSAFDGVAWIIVILALRASWSSGTILSFVCFDVLAMPVVIWMSGPYVHQNECRLVQIQLPLVVILGRIHFGFVSVRLGIDPMHRTGLEGDGTTFGWLTLTPHSFGN